MLAVLRATEMVEPVSGPINFGVGTGAPQANAREVRLTMACDGAPTLDVDAALQQLHAGVEELISRLEKRAAADGYLRESLCAWIDRLRTPPDAAPPRHLLDIAQAASLPALETLPFKHRCPIPTTKRIHTPANVTLPVGLQLPHS